MLRDDSIWPVVVTVKDGAIRLPHETFFQFLSVEGEGNAADTVTSIIGGKPGDLLVLQTHNASAAVTIDDTYISCGGADKVLTALTDKVTLICSARNTWHLLASVIS